MMLIVSYQTWLTNRKIYLEKNKWVFVLGTLLVWILKFMRNFCIYNIWLILIDATLLCTKIRSELTSLGLTNRIVVAQCYDGASVMSDRLNGVQAKFSETNQCALYIHCHAHRLNLVIVDVAHEVKCASEFFALVESLYVFLTRHKVHEVFVSLQVKYGVVVRELGRLSDTRWASRYRNLAVLDERIGIVIEVLHQVQETCDADIVVHARGLYHKCKQYSLLHASRFSTEFCRCPMAWARHCSHQLWILPNLKHWL